VGARLCLALFDSFLLFGHGVGKAISGVGSAVQSAVHCVAR
jgi:hypothetical protein